jgi:hypothetical protein
VNVSSGKEHEWGRHQEGVGEEEEYVWIGESRVWSETVKGWERIREGESTVNCVSGFEHLYTM